MNRIFQTFPLLSSQVKKSTSISHIRTKCGLDHPNTFSTASEIFSSQENQIPHSSSVFGFNLYGVRSETVRKWRASKWDRQEWKEVLSTPVCEHWFCTEQRQRVWRDKSGAYWCLGFGFLLLGFLLLGRLLFLLLLLITLTAVQLCILLGCMYHDKTNQWLVNNQWLPCSSAILPHCNSFAYSNNQWYATQYSSWTYVTTCSNSKQPLNVPLMQFAFANQQPHKPH